MQCVCQRQVTVQRAARCFSTTTKRSRGLGLGANDQAVVKDTVPEYPYGPTRLFRRSGKGLFGSSRIRFGNNTSEEFKTRTRRTWLPNVHKHTLFSKALATTIKLPVTPRVLRTIEKVGGIDEYLLGEKEARIKELGETGWWLRWAIMQTGGVKARFARERAKLGLPPKTVDEAEPPLEDDSIIRQLEANRARLFIRTKDDQYMHFREGSWRGYKTKMTKLIRLRQKYSPTRMVKELDATIGPSDNPKLEKQRAAFYQCTQTNRRKVTEAMARVQPWEKRVPDAHLLDPKKPGLNREHIPTVAEYAKLEKMLNKLREARDKE